MDMMPMDIKLAIGRLQLDGFAHADRVRIGATLEGELRRLIATGALGDARRSIRIDRVDAGGLAASPASTPETIGAQVARQVVQQLRSGTASAVPTVAPMGGDRRRGGR